MRGHRWAIAAFAGIGRRAGRGRAAGLLYVTGPVADRPLPFGGTLATASAPVIAVLARTTGPARRQAPAAPRWARRAGLAGLAALTARAALVDARHGGAGWPAHATD